jgi:hypothetical protein
MLSIKDAGYAYDPCVLDVPEGNQPSLANEGRDCRLG